MKTFGKILGLTALAALVPIRFRTEDSGRKTFQSLLWKLDIGPDENEEGLEIGLDLTDGIATNAVLRAVTARKEARIITDDPAEALFTDNAADIAAEELADLPADTATGAPEA